jgi:hypothetical protein
VNAPKAASNQSKSLLSSHLLLLYLVISYYAHLCCFEEKSVRVCLMRQGLTPFHVSLHVFVRTVAVLELVPDGVCVVWAGLLEKPLEVVHRRPCRTLVSVHGGRDVPHAEAAHLPVVAVIVASHRHSPLKALFAPLVATFDALLSAMSGDVERCLLVATRCHLPASQCRAKHGCLVAGGALGGDAARLLKCAPEEVVMSTLSWALCVVIGQCACATLAANL